MQTVVLCVLLVLFVCVMVAAVIALGRQKAEEQRRWIKEYNAPKNVRRRLEIAQIEARHRMDDIEEAMERSNAIEEEVQS